ncbi:hypothetical protein H0E84_05140 [Luteimonas sp. SJ-92]|uniref:Uncharacterized protein n=1 Tax=Luteimonas salinisoli TaxID=2752307 RepID=A0A853J9C2_9GAMM|nr:hypothetical protein [Luteimonas salinisoli]NZA25761.1 hypothetical protein [Luteimonas salinisoli]
MKHRAILLLVLVVALLSGTARAGTVVLVADEELCDNAPPLEQAAHLKPSRNGNKVTLIVTAQLNCAYIPDNPELREWRNAATVSLPTRSPSGMATACLCAHRMEFEITDMNEGVQIIYYVQDGTVLGHTDAP